MELVVVDYLTEDSALRTLLGAVGGDTKIYPSQAPQGAALPYILYNTVADGTLEENLLERSLNFNCVADTLIETQDIRNRVNELLDKQDDIKKFIFSTEYWFYWSKQVGGTTFKDPELGVFYAASVYNFKYAKFTIEDMQMLCKLIDQLGNFINEGNPLYTADRPETSVRDYAAVSTIASGSYSTILSHTVTDKILWADALIVTGTVDAEIIITIDTITKFKYRTSEQDRTMHLQFPVPQRFSVGTIIDVKIRHWRSVTADFSTTLVGHKYNE